MHLFIQRGSARWCWPKESFTWSIRSWTLSYCHDAGTDAWNEKTWT